MPNPRRDTAATGAAGTGTLALPLSGGGGVALAPSRPSCTPLSPAGRHTERLAWAALVVVLLAGVVVRALVVFADAWPRGINGGYYPVQVRAVLRSGTLALPDFPLLFYVQAAVALILTPFCSDHGRAIVIATQLTDTVLPCLVAVPVFLLARAWVTPERRRNLPVVVLFAGLTAVANPLALRMAGDLQKNSAALGLSLLFVYFADSYLRSRRVATAIGALLSLGLTGLTHLGVFGMSLLLALLLGATTVWDSRNRRCLLLAIPAVGIVCLVAALVIFIGFDPTRIGRLVSYSFAPLRFLRQVHPPGLNGPVLQGPPGMLLRPEVLPGLALGAMGVWMWLLFLEVDRVQRHTVLACSLAALGLACPWLTPDMGTRLALMSVAPGIVSIVFALAHWPRVWGCALAGGGIALVALSGSVRMTQANSPGIIRPETVSDLRQIAAHIQDPARTLIVARHGLEWWTAWFTGAHIANNMEAALSVWDRYERVYSLVETQAPRGPGGVPPGRAPGGVLPGWHPGADMAAGEPGLPAGPAGGVPPAAPADPRRQWPVDYPADRPPFGDPRLTDELRRPDGGPLPPPWAMPPPAGDRPYAPSGARIPGRGPGGLPRPPLGEPGGSPRLGHRGPDVMSSPQAPPGEHFGPAPRDVVYSGAALRLEQFRTKPPAGPAGPVRF